MVKEDGPEDCLAPFSFHNFNSLHPSHTIRTIVTYCKQQSYPLPYNFNPSYLLNTIQGLTILMEHCLTNWFKCHALSCIWYVTSNKGMYIIILRRNIFLKCNVHMHPITHIYNNLRPTPSKSDRFDLVFYYLLNNIRASVTHGTCAGNLSPTDILL